MAIIRGGSIVGLVGVVVAVLAWQFPKAAGNPSAPASSAPSQAPLPSSSAPTTVPATALPATTFPPSSVTAPSTPAPGRYLLDLQPQDGAANLAVVRDGAHRTFAVHCGSGNTDDQHRSVSWLPVGRYATLAALVVPTGRVDPDTTTQVEVLVNDIVVDNRPELPLNTAASIRVDLPGPVTVGFRVTCRDPAGEVLFRDARLVR